MRLTDCLKILKKEIKLEFRKLKTLNLNKKIVMIFFITIFLFLRKSFFKLILNNFNEVVFFKVQQFTKTIIIQQNNIDFLIKID